MTVYVFRNLREKSRFVRISANFERDLASVDSNLEEPSVHLLAKSVIT